MCFRHLVLLEVISFDKIPKTVAQKFAIELNNLGTHFLSVLVTRTYGFLLTVAATVEPG